MGTSKIDSFLLLSFNLFRLNLHSGLLLLIIWYSENQNSENFRFRY